MIAAMTAVGISAFAQVTMTAKTTWGGGDGWIAAGDVSYLTNEASPNQRSIAYSHATGRLLLVNALSVRGLNGSTGNSEVLLNTTGITGGDRALNQIGVTSDGVIFGSNLRAAMSSTATFKVYRWQDETAAPTTAFSGNLLTGGRLGDSFDVIGSGSNTQIVAGYGTAASATGYAVLNGDTTLTGTSYPLAGTASGDFRLGASFIDSDTVIGTQNATASANGVRVSSFGPGGAVLDRTYTLEDTNERAMEVVTFNGLTLMATIQVLGGVPNQNKVRIYNLSGLPTSGALTSIASMNLTNSANANAQAIGDLAWGGVNGNTISLYALNASNGIQAFDVQVVPEPATMAVLGLGVAAVLRRKRKNA